MQDRKSGQLRGSAEARPATKKPDSREGGHSRGCYGARRRVAEPPGCLRAQPSYFLTPPFRCSLLFTVSVLYQVPSTLVYGYTCTAKKEVVIVIDRDQFKSALGLKESLFINRMFLMFDTGKLRISTTMTGNNFGPFFFVCPSPFSPT